MIVKKVTLVLLVAIVLMVIPETALGAPENLTVDGSADFSPSEQKYVKGMIGADIVAFEFGADGAGDIRVTQLEFEKVHPGLSDTDITNVTLYDAETGERLKNTNGVTIPSSSMFGGRVIFGSNSPGLDPVGLFDILRGTHKYVLLRADIPTVATSAADILALEITDPTTDVRADGIASATDLIANDVNSGSTATVPNDSIDHDIIDHGELVVFTSADTPATASYIPGQEDVWFAKFDLRAAFEAVDVAQINILFAANTTGTMVAASNTDVNNIKLWEDDQLLGVIGTISNGRAEFGTDIYVPRNSTKTITVRADVPTTTSAMSLEAWIETSGDIITIGEDSGQTITPQAPSGWEIKGNTMWNGAPVPPIPELETYMLVIVGLVAILILTQRIPGLVR